MGQALYRKYRSKSLAEIVGQPHITTTLDNALKNGAISHAYLFTGPRGTGKTSIARILAHEVNRLPYSDETHLDIIEIDAASNRRIDEIRELRERVHTAPTSAKYKVYIIDEVHMLTKEAFNALLKTLEEPPAHAIFILATTEAHKLPETIVSRTQRFTFKPVEQARVVAHLQSIAKQESVNIDDEALELVARHGGGSFRDSISLLDQVRSHADQVTLANVQSMLGLAPDAAIDELVRVLQSGTPGELVAVLSGFREQGYQPGQIAKQLAKQLRQHILENTSPLPHTQVPRILSSLVAVPASHDPEAALEIALLGIIIDRSDLPHVQIAEPPVVDVVKPVATEHQSNIEAPKKEKESVKPKPAEEQPKPKVEAPKPKAPKSSSQALSEEAWSQALATIKQSHNTLYSVARMATPLVEEDTITLEFKFAFHQKRLNETKNKQILATILEEIVGRPVTITCSVNAKAAATPSEATQLKPAPKQQATDTTVSTISNIFGAAEVLE